MKLASNGQSSNYFFSENINYILSINKIIIIVVFFRKKYVC